MDGGVCGSDVVLEETFYVFSKKNSVYKVKLTEKGLVLIKESNGQTKTETISIDDVVGARCMRSKRKYSSNCVCGPNGKKSDMKVVEENSADQDENDISAYLYIYAYILKKYRVKSGEQREKMTITLRFRSFDRFQDNMIEAQRWQTAIRCLVKKRPIPGSVRNHDYLTVSASPGSGKEDTRPLLILLNPKSGPGRARDMFQAKVAPVLYEAEVGYDLHVTKHENYARDFVRLRDVFQWRGIVVVGGDGILFEVLNGIFERLDWKLVLNELPLGIIPCGSGNGLARAIAHASGEPYDSNPWLISALNVVSGRSRPMDVIRVETTKETMFSFLSIGWGLLADIDIESEKLRAIGSPRFSIWSVARLIGLRTYRGKLYIKRSADVGKRRENQNLVRSVSESANVGGPQSNLHNSQSCDDVLDSADILSLDTFSATTSPIRERADSYFSVTSKNSAYYSVAGSSYKSTASIDGIEPRRESVPVTIYGPESQLPELRQPLPSSGWDVIDGEFVMVHATYQSHIGSDCFLAPGAQLNDGIIWLMVVRAGASRNQLLQILLGLSNGTHVENPNLEVIPCTAFRLVPDKGENSYGHLTVDGESVTYGALQAEIVPNAASVMCR